MISLLLFALQVFSTTSVQGIAANEYPPECECWGSMFCITKESRKYLTQKVEEIMSPHGKKPVYVCYMESESQWELLSPGYINEYGEDYVKLYKQKSFNRQPKQPEIKTFLEEAIEEWKSNITKIEDKKHFGCQVTPDVKGVRAVCLFTY
ncbi:hypothetical protein Y032_0043g842 [Ancylostoma ceylanicum]|uniref:SCP domain-containing protein n=1 Tax=Ancylostoma ceylanicum TaxID=53326 RepID=A0A016UEB6_9BILA|nr:hypothetical protein Y032_0043g842 [Ancylostoma ceylanicum]